MSESVCEKHMAKVIDISDINLEFTDLEHRVLAGSVNRNQGVPTKRPGGVHQSGVLLAIARSMPALSKKLDAMGKDEEEYPLLWALGVAWEEFAVSLHPEIHWQPGTQVKNGIARSPDGISRRDGKLIRDPFHVLKSHRQLIGTDRVDEFKFTFKKVRSAAEFLEEWLWLHQVRGYCSLYPGCVTGRWHVMHVKGDYKVFQPVYRTYTVEFTEKEVEATEKMLVSNAHRAVPE